MPEICKMHTAGTIKSDSRGQDTEFQQHQRVAVASQKSKPHVRHVRDLISGPSKLEEWRVVERVVKVFLILLDGFGPIKVALHPILHQTVVLFFILAVDLQGPVQNLLHLVRGQGEDVEAVGSLALGRVRTAGIPHAVSQAAGGVHDGQGAVRERDHLRDPARFVAGWHQQEVAPRHHLPFYLWIKTNVAAHTAFIPALNLAEPVS
mmetsp:Transcript_112467/g.318167  ORF Transcript_112467/g.318167 Transcript_112467/m.318167 type:complete len:206 (+) Transcript_112467:346-963(+)